MTAYDRLMRARAKERPTACAVIGAVFDGFVELHGDRRFGDDEAIVGGIAALGKTPVTVLGIERGTDTKERVRRNFGSAQPEGYRKALRLMKQAEKFGRPVICLVDTAGAYCGVGAEERGQGQAIAENLYEMSALKVPVVSVIIGEGGSGGALALSVADRVYMLENAVYSVISPEGCASILWKDAAKVRQAAADLGITAADLYEKRAIDGMIPEPEDYFRNPAPVFETLKNQLAAALGEISALDTETMLAKRYERFRRLGRGERVDAT